MAHKILIVDDEPNIVISLEFLMKKEGFEVAVANDGEEALAKAASFAPDLMLLDVMMPEMDGYEVMRLLKADERTSHVPVVLLTALDDPESTARELGADGYLPKPFDLTDLSAVVNEYLSAD